MSVVRVFHCNIIDLVRVAGLLLIHMYMAISSCRIFNQFIYHTKYVNYAGLLKVGYIHLETHSIIMYCTRANLSYFLYDINKTTPPPPATQQEITPPPKKKRNQIFH